MEREQQQTILTDKEKEALLELLWVEKKDRLSDHGSNALYVALDSPRPNLAEIANRMLETLSLPENFLSSYNWALKWGRVVVCIQPGGQLGCVLGNVNDNESKRYVPVRTTLKFAPDELLGGAPQGSLGTILLNSKPTTVEATTIAYVHMVDELIWDLRRTALNEDTRLSAPDVYMQVVERVKKEGFAVGVATEDEILLAKKFNPNVLVRLYGSGVNKDISKVMGAVLPPAIKEKV